MLGLPLPLFIGLCAGSASVIFFTAKDFYLDCFKKRTKTKKLCNIKMNMISIGTSVVAILVLYIVLFFLNWLYLKL